MGSPTLAISVLLFVLLEPDNLSFFLPFDMYPSKCFVDFSFTGEKDVTTP